MIQEEKYVYMTTAPVEEIIPKLAGPTIISMLVTSFYSMVDTFFVGKLNTSAQAGVGVTFSMMAIIQAFGFLFGHGSGNYISRALGRKDTEKASTMSACGFFYALLAGILLAAAGLIFMNPLCYLLGATQTSLPYTRKYLSIILIGAPVMTASLVLNNQLRFQGNAFYAMIGIVTGTVINIMLDPLLMFGCGLGVSGAALATVISQTISFVLLLIGTRKGGTIRISIRKLKFSGYYIKEIIRGGIPSLCRQGIASIATIILNQAAGAYSDAAIAGMSIVGRVSFFINAAIIGFGQGFQPVCGFNYGARLYDRVRKAYWFCVKTGFAFLLIASTLAFFLATPLISLFTKGDAEVIAIGAKAFRFQCISFPLSSFIVMSNMLLQSVGKAVPASILALARQGLFYIPAIIVLSFLFGLKGIEIAQPIADVFSFILAIPFMIWFLREMKQAEK